MKGPIKNPALYRRMSEPLASAQATEAATEAFFADLQALRERHHIRDVVAIVQIPYVEGGEEAVALRSMVVGNKAEALPMLAVCYGSERANWSSTLDKVAGGAS